MVSSEDLSFGSGNVKLLDAFGFPLVGRRRMVADRLLALSFAATSTAHPTQLHPPPQPSPPAPRPRLSRHRLVFLFYLSFLWLVLSDGAFFHLGWVPARALLAGWPLAFCLAGGLAGWPDRPLHDAPFTSSSLSFHLSFLSPFLAFPLLASPIFQALSAAP